MGRRTLFLIIAVMTIAIVVVALRMSDERSPIDAESAALELVKNGVAQESRRDGDRWEVDVVRDDGSMVQVVLDDSMRLVAVDDEDPDDE